MVAVVVRVCVCMRACGVQVKRRVVRRAFYSSEEDESTEEEVYEQEATTATPEVRATRRTYCSCLSHNAQTH